MVEGKKSIKIKVKYEIKQGSWVIQYHSKKKEKRKNLQNSLVNRCKIMKIK